MRLSDAGLRQRQTKALYPNHRLPPWPTEDAAPRSLEPIVRCLRRGQQSAPGQSDNLARRSATTEPTCKGSQHLSQHAATLCTNQLPVKYPPPTKSIVPPPPGHRRANAPIWRAPCKDQSKFARGSQVRGCLHEMRRERGALRETEATKRGIRFASRLPRRYVTSPGT
jgi:hypothetical protein